MDCCSERLNPFNIHIGDSDQVSTNPRCGGDHQIDITKPAIVIPCRWMAGRYVGVRLTGPSRILTLCEVQVITVGECSNGYWHLPHTRRCYRAYDTESEYEEALATCREEGSTLAMPGDSATNDFLVALKNAADKTKLFYFGMTRSDDGTWTYARGSQPMEWENWAEGEPTGGKQRCAAYFPDNSSDVPYDKRNKWNDVGCKTDAAFICEFEYCQVGDGASYRETVSVTRTGKTCQRWDRQLPHSHDKTPDNYPSSGLEENYCRNPDGESGVWCYTTNALQRWELCDVPVCARKWREDLRCGKDYLVEHGKPAECDPGSHYPCCSSENHCGSTAADCDCLDCVNYRDTLSGICANGNVIDKTQICDDTDDCGDNTDEQQNCCERRGRKSCANGHTCIDNSNFCDRVTHCADGSDELYCPLSACDNGGLFHPYTRCDGRDDCGDNSDEKNCGCYYLRDKGSSYRGRKNQLDSCQFWTSQNPHAHNHTPEAYPSAGLERNYCRNPDGKDRPWCYIDNPLIRWMYCDKVFPCDAVPTSCFFTYDKGRSYAGNVNRAGDRLCQRWDSQSPHSHRHTPQAHSGAGLEENFCRNPDNKDRPWCYTTDPTLRWDYCNVTECDDPTSLCSRMSCKRRCGRPYDSSIACQCDQECSFFSDCCKDIGEVCNITETVRTPSDRDQEKWKCLSGYDKGRSYWLVAGCPDDLTDDVTTDQCLKEADPYNPGDLVYRMPVYDTSTNISYKNIFCAFCNNVSMEQVIIWEAELVCTGLINSSTNPVGVAQLYNKLNISIGNCRGTPKLEFEDPFIMKSITRICIIPYKVDMLNVNCNVTACRSYDHRVTFNQQKIYKNIHCALCEGISLASTTHLQCYNPSPRIVFSLISLTYLFNFNAGESHENNPNHCPPDSLYDSFVDSCRPFSSVSHGPSLPLQNCSRPILNFTSEEFQVLPNGSVRLLSSNGTCPAEQVVILNTSASICGDCLLWYFSNDTLQTTWDATKSWLTLGLVSASDIAVAGFVFYTYKSGQWKKVPEKLKVQMMTCMAVAVTQFVARVFIPPGLGCTVYAILLHYFMLTAFTSMNVLAVDIFLTFHEDLERAELYKYILYTWLVPVPVVLVTVIVEFGSSVRVGYGEQCWIGNPTASLVAFGVPVFCALMINGVFTILVLLALQKSFQIANAALPRSEMSKIWVYIRVLFLAGFTWILGFIFPFVKSEVLEYIFIVLNASQGLLMTLFMTLTGEVLEKWKSAIMARFGLAEAHQDNGQTTTTTHIRQTTGGKTEVTAGGTGSAIEIPMTIMADVEEDRARHRPRKPRQKKGRNAPAGNKPTTEGGTEAKSDETDTAGYVQALAGEVGATASGTDVATEIIPMKTFVNAEENKDENSASDRDEDETSF
ncbi:uncharacterized protein LOC144911180 isoform X2 [Branchiostoma floridae x Branchiostoma belcheri]